jgi:chemotaxis protein CheD
MNAPGTVMDVFLQPGDAYFAARDTRLRTVLGSCVSVVLWHPILLLGGMCHFMLPSRAEARSGASDARYADEAFELMLRDIRRHGTRPDEYQVKLFGGANMFPDSHQGAARHVGTKNVEAARRLVRTHGMTCTSEHLEGIGHRTIIFEVWSGQVWVKQCAPIGFDGNRSGLSCAA